MHFVFAPDTEVDQSNLVQGDILIRDEGLATALAQAHSYYASATDYSHFMVLTQSCDLVRRKGKKRPKSPYITLAAIRPFSVLMNRYLQKLQLGTIDETAVICDVSKQLFAEQFLERLLHNTEDEVIFFRKGSHPSVTEDMCVFLKLSVALRVDHYETCLSAKVAQLTDVFAAKIGWSVGNLYSRVGTPDIEEKLPDPEEYKKLFFREALDGRAFWLSPQQFRLYCAREREWRAANPAHSFTREVALSIIRGLESDMEIVAEKFLDILREGKFFEPDAEVQKKAKLAIANNRRLKALLRNSQF